MMFWSWVLPCALLAAASGARAEEPSGAFGSQKEKESYSIGYQVGESLKRDGVAVDWSTLVNGLRDGAEGKEPRLGVEEMRDLIVDLRKRARETQLRSQQELIVRNAEESKRFLEENAKKEGVRTTESGLQYTIIEEGAGQAPLPEDSVTVHYRGTFVDGREFDSSYAKGQPQVFTTDGVIKGWTEALQMMKVGSKWRVVVPPELAYGRAGLGERIGPNKTLIFEIELLSIQEGK